MFNEQPSAAKWNILGTNDASFNDGTGIGTNAIAAASLDTSAISLGQSKATTVQTGITTIVDLTNLSVAVTIPEGSRRILIHGHIQIEGSVDGNVAQLSIKEGATVLNVVRARVFTAGAWVSMDAFYEGASPSAGAHTYKLTLERSVGAGTLSTVADATYENFIKVLVI